jgi:hypothetical protein
MPGIGRRSWLAAVAVALAADAIDTLSGAFVDR